MGRKGNWLNVVKKIFGTESKEKNDEKSKKKLELEAPCPSDPCSANLSALPATETETKQLDDKLVETEEQKPNVSAKTEAVENSVDVIQAAGDIQHLEKPAKFCGKSSEDVAAIKIQTVFRGHHARRALRSARGRERLKSLLGGNSVKRQATTTLHYMQTLARVQAQVHSRRIRMSEENQALQRQMLLKHERDLEKLKMGDEWDDSLQTKEQIEAGLLNKQEAAIRRERAMAYAFNHQWKSSSRSVNPMYLNPSNPQWGWSWLERWMATKPTEAKKIADKDVDNASVKNFSQKVEDGEKVKDNPHSTVADKPSPVVQKLTRNASRKSLATPPAKAPWTTSSKRNSASPKVGSVVSDDESRSIVSTQSERHRRHSITGLSVRDVESLASSSFRSYMAPTVSTRARSRNQSPSHDAVEATDKLTPSLKKKLSFPASPPINRRHSEPPKVGL